MPGSVAKICFITNFWGQWWQQSQCKRVTWRTEKQNLYLFIIRLVFILHPALLVGWTQEGFDLGKNYVVVLWLFAGMKQRKSGLTHFSRACGDFGWIMQECLKARWGMFSFMHSENVNSGSELPWHLDHTYASVSTKIGQKMEFLWSLHCFVPGAC